MRNLESIEQFEQLKKEGKHLFVFSADWCPDCRFADMFLPEVESKFKDYIFIHVDRDEYIDLCQQLDIFGIPSFIAFNNGTELGRFVSKDRKTQEEIETFISGLK
ncbi:thioredoxin family protein [Calidifontibacillus oryziterrae]|uniref:thioredoxin family protein n=1 Tax=Calidifontibacillus oryziterrae TaxID=1191699 RepID=UPI0002ED67A0|nr:thioredoxin family protein [Calidifontibacillus oryziterrae]